MTTTPTEKALKPLSERIRDEMGCWPSTSSLSAVLRECAELARRVEEAPSVEITACNQIEGARDFDYGNMVAASQKFAAGQHVRLVLDFEEGSNGIQDPPR